MNRLLFSSLLVQPENAEADLIEFLQNSEKMIFEQDAYCRSYFEAVTILTRNAARNPTTQIYPSIVSIEVERVTLFLDNIMGTSIKQGRVPKNINASP